MLPLVQAFVAASQCILAFSHAALVVGTLSAAITGAAKATVRPRAATIKTSFFIVFSSLFTTFW
jgi:hypothetical protein